MNLTIFDYVKHMQPYIVSKLIGLGWKPYAEADFWDDPEFRFYDKLMRQTPRPGRGGDV